MAELASPPEFGMNGAPPPLHSAPILVGDDYFLTKAATGRRALWVLLTGHLSGSEFSDARRWIEENCHADDVPGLAHDSPVCGCRTRPEAAEHSEI